MLNATKLGLISDTHGLLRPQALEALKGSELILHAGDVGKPEILEELRKIAPVIAIRGNVDTAPWAQTLKETELVETAAANIYILHNLNDLDLNPAAAGIQIILYGHSHQPSRTEKDGVLYINPGSAGPRRFNLPITIARLNLSVTPWSFELIHLDRTR
ncbi:MAG TPA: metallophosphoesterase family protein [Candidatus Dormibacteraeota bacterium]|jgi:putative phosphoesterase|nr:metallophosphoesterase family protein [Candidatus Dormibacteraeota bacterium]